MTIYEKELHILVQQGKSHPRIGMSLPKHQIPLLQNHTVQRSKHMQSLRELKKMTDRLAQMNISKQSKPSIYEAPI